jgi:hypothetical protein
LIDVLRGAWEYSTLWLLNSLFVIINQAIHGMDNNFFCS